MTQYMSQYNKEMQHHYLKDLSLHRSRVCSFCGVSSVTNFHHIYPINYLGKHHANNIIELCIPCHRKAECGIIDVGEGRQFVWAVKKHHKLMLKFYKEEPNKMNPSSEFVRKHLGIDSACKHLIKFKHFDRLEDMKKYWASQNIIRNI